MKKSFKADNAFKILLHPFATGLKHIKYPITTASQLPNIHYNHGDIFNYEN